MVERHQLKRAAAYYYLHKTTICIRGKVPCLGPGREADVSQHYKLRQYEEKRKKKKICLGLHCFLPFPFLPLPSQRKFTQSSSACNDLNTLGRVAITREHPLNPREIRWQYVRTGKSRRTSKP